MYNIILSTTTPPIEIVELENLESLVVYDNLIIEIPKEISMLKNLENLIIHGNPICEYPEKIKELQELLPNTRISY